MKKIQKFENFLKEEFGQITSREYPGFDYPREEGYYKIKFHGEWMPAEYSKIEDGSRGIWVIPGSDEEFNENEIDEIGSKIEFENE